MYLQSPPSADNGKRSSWRDSNGHVIYTSDFENDSWAVVHIGFPTFHRYRLVLGEVANSIQLFRNTKELVQTFRDALEGKYLIRLLP